MGDAVGRCGRSLEREHTVSGDHLKRVDLTQLVDQRLSEPLRHELEGVRAPAALEVQHRDVIRIERRIARFTRRRRLRQSPVRTKTGDSEGYNDAGDYRPEPLPGSPLLPQYCLRRRALDRRRRARRGSPTAGSPPDVLRRTAGMPRDVVRLVATVGSRSASTSANSLIFWNRSAGVFSSACMTASSSSSGTDCRTTWMLGTCSIACRAMIDREFGP